MNRRQALVGLAAGSVAASGVSYAQGNSGAGGAGTGTNLRALLVSTTGGGTVGTFDVKRFAAIDNALHAIGTISVTETTGTGTRTVVSTLAVPVTLSTGSTGSVIAQQQQECPILHLAIGPIDLDLLGLVITTAPIVIDIVAVPGPGNLLGNLLCAIAGLLDPGGAIGNLLNQIVALLNQLLGQL